MTQVPDSILEIINGFIAEAAKDNIKISDAILFGSYANGNYGEYSDIDLAIVSNDFEDNFFYDNKKISRPKLRTSYDLETHTYTPQDFNSSNPFVNEILKTGIRIL